MKRRKNADSDGEKQSKQTVNTQPNENVAESSENEQEEDQTEMVSTMCTCVQLLTLFHLVIGFSNCNYNDPHARK